MRDTRFFYTVIDPDNMQDGSFMSPVFLHDTGFIAQNGEGWEPVDHTVFEDGNGRFFVSIMAQREHSVPGDVRGLQ